MAINRHIATPLYEQIRLELREQIMNGTYPPGSQLPTEATLCVDYQVSRITVVRALAELESEGLIERVQGKGSIVSYHRPLGGREGIEGHSAQMARSGKVTRSKLLGVEVVPKSRDLANLFGLPQDETPNFMRIRRLRYVDETPAVIMNSIMLESLGKRMLEYDLETESFYRLYEKIWGLPVIRNETSLTPILADEEIASLLEVKVGSPHYLFRGFSFLEGDIPVELCLAIYRGNKFTWSTNIYQFTQDSATEGRLGVERQLIKSI